MNSWKPTYVDRSEQPHEKTFSSHLHPRESVSVVALSDIDRSDYLHCRYVAHLDIPGFLNVHIKENPVTDPMLPVLEKYIAEQILKQPDRRISADEPLISSGLIDSFSLMDLALFVEDTFGVRIEDTELNANTFDTLNQLATLITSRK
jgi:acyl carrier protein